MLAINGKYAYNRTTYSSHQDSMTDSELIDALGGTAKLAEICDVTSQAVSQWRDDGIPDARRQLLSVLYPDVVTYVAKAEREPVIPVA